MSRSGYSEVEFDSLESILSYGRQVAATNSAIKGKRGQAFLKELLAALDALPEKRLIPKELKNESGMVCALGSVAEARGIETKGIDVYNVGLLSKMFNISPTLVREIEFLNDKNGYGPTPDQVRFENVRAWVASQIINEDYVA